MHDELRTIADDWWDGSMARNPTLATRLGDHRFDDAIEDPSPAGLADERAFAVAFDELGAFTLGAVVLFLFNAFFIADAYVWRRGGFEWD